MNEKEFILLVGPQGSGKTTLCAQRFPGHLRISKDDQGPKHIHALNEALSKGVEKIVLDRTNASRTSRAKYIHFARRNGYRTKIVWVNVDYDTCLARIRARRNHPTLQATEAVEALSWYFRTFRTPASAEVDEIEILGDSPKFVPIKDIRPQLAGRRFLITSDIHGCLDELLQMLDERDFDLTNDILVSAGDLVDRGPNSKGVLDFCMSLPNFYGVMGNHDDRCIRHFNGVKVKDTDGLRQTIEEFAGVMPNETLSFMESFDCILATPAGFVVHAGFDPLLPVERQQRRDCLYMRNYGGEDYFDDVNGDQWFRQWPKEGPKVFFGHEANPRGYVPNHTVSLDGGCCFGDYLKAFDSKDEIVHYVNAKMRYAEPYVSP